MVQREPSNSVAHPVRTCVGCRQRALAVDLLRVVARDVGTEGFAVVSDPRRRLPGRGAWLHPDSSCLGAAERRRAFGRALRVTGNPDISALRRYLQGEERETGTSTHEHTVKHQR